MRPNVGWLGAKKKKGSVMQRWECYVGWVDTQDQIGCIIRDGWG